MTQFLNYTICFVFNIRFPLIWVGNEDKKLNKKDIELQINKKNMEEKVISNNWKQI